MANRTPEQIVVDFIHDNPDWPLRYCKVEWVKGADGEWYIVAYSWNTYPHEQTVSNNWPLPPTLP